MKKIRIRNLPPCWSFPGQSRFAVQVSVTRAMFAGETFAVREE